MSAEPRTEPTSLDAIPQGDLALLEHPVAQELLAAAIPARLGYVAPDGTPRVTPMWFTWNGTELVFGAAGNSPKVKAIQANPAVAVSIDTDAPPYRALAIRGVARVEILDGAVDEYADSALRYLGSVEGARVREHIEANFTGMARITVRATWVGLIDFRTRYPSNF